MDMFHLNIALVDDIQSELDTLSQILGEYAAASQLDLTLHCFHSAEDVLTEYQPFRYTVIFMDIYMEGMTGMEATERIRAVDRDTLIIFLTTSGEHMPHAFRYHAYDYIRKPAEKARLFAVMDDILRRHTEISDSPKITFTSNRRDYSIPCSDIIYIRTEANYLGIMDKSGNTYRTRMTFSAIKHRLRENNHFLQILRGVLVNMDYIENFDDGICHLTGDIKFPVNVRNAKKIEQVWRNYVFSGMRRKQRDLLQESRMI